MSAVLSLPSYFGRCQECVPRQQGKYFDSLTILYSPPDLFGHPSLSDGLRSCHPCPVCPHHILQCQWPPWCVPPCWTHHATGSPALDLSSPFVLAWTLAKKRNNAKGKRKEKKNKRTIRCRGNFGSKYTFWVRDVDDTYWMFNVQGPVVHLLFNELTNARQDYLIYSRNVLIERSAS